MKTKEFIEQAEKIGLKVIIYKDTNEIFLKLPGTGVAATVSINQLFEFNIGYCAFYLFDFERQQKIFDLLTEYSRTPIEERQEEKKYMYRLKKIDGVEYDSYDYLNWNYMLEYFLVADTSSPSGDYKIQFTHSWLEERGVDIKQLKEVYEEIEVE